jgi:hypothetical protein
MRQEREREDYLHGLVLCVEREDLLDQRSHDLDQKIATDRLAVGREQVRRYVVATEEGRPLDDA